MPKAKLIKILEYFFWFLGIAALATYAFLLGQNNLAQSQATNEFVEAKRELQELHIAPANTAMTAISPRHNNPEGDLDTTTDTLDSSSDVPAKELKVDADSSDKSLWSDSFIGHYEDALAKGGDSAIALLKIPNVDLEVAVFNGADKHNLNRGAARIASTGLINGENRIGIAGHRDGWFRPLKDIKIGDIIELETLTETRRYQINKTHIVTPSDIEVLQGDNNTLVLVTCYPFYFVGSAPERFIVEAVQLSSKS